MSEYLTLIIGGCILIVGFLTIIVSKHQKKSNHYDGAIRVNTSNPEKDTYTLELNISFGELESRDQVIFEIIRE